MDRVEGEWWRERANGWREGDWVLEGGRWNGERLKSSRPSTRSSLAGFHRLEAASRAKGSRCPRRGRGKETPDPGRRPSSARGRPAGAGAQPGKAPRTRRPLTPRPSPQSSRVESPRIQRAVAALRAHQRPRAVRLLDAAENDEPQRAAHRDSRMRGARRVGALTGRLQQSVLRGSALPQPATSGG